jgi:hypothetical protein
MTICWEERGCDEEMSSRCPHAISSTDGMCVADCYYTNCDKPQHKNATSFELLLDATVDRSKAIKEPCTFCEFFLVNGPRLAPSEKCVGAEKPVDSEKPVGAEESAGTQHSQSAQLVQTTQSAQPTPPSST